MRSLLSLCKLQNPRQYLNLYSEYTSKIQVTNNKVNVSSLMATHKIPGYKLLFNMANLGHLSVRNVTWDEAQSLCGQFISTYKGRPLHNFFVKGIPSFGSIQNDLKDYTENDSKDTKNYSKDKTDPRLHTQIINTTLYDMAYGNIYTFHNVMIKLLDEQIKYQGNSSIKFESTANKIKKACDITSNEDLYNKLYNEIVNNTTHSVNDTVIDITRLLNKYKIKSEELYSCMIDQSYSMCRITVCKNVLDKNNYYIGSLNTLFRQSMDESQFINIYNNPHIYDVLVELVIRG